MPSEKQKMTEMDIFLECVQQVSHDTAALLKEKNIAYGNSINTATDVMAILYPDGVKTNQIDDALVVVRILDKLSRIARGNKHAFDESPWGDIAGYAILQRAKEEVPKRSTEVAARQAFMRLVQTNVDPDSEEYKKAVNKLINISGKSQIQVSPEE